CALPISGQAVPAARGAVKARHAKRCEATCDCSPLTLGATRSRRQCAGGHLGATIEVDHHAC
ncbi:MAG: hypothetical protein VB934_12355, partial [Polyangiaceae bacterium]